MRSAAVVRFFEHHVVELEKQLCMGDQRGFFQNVKLLQLEETDIVESQYTLDENGDWCETKNVVAKFFILILDSPKRLPQR